MDAVVLRVADPAVSENTCLATGERQTSVPSLQPLQNQCENPCRYGLPCANHTVEVSRTSGDGTLIAWNARGAGSELGRQNFRRFGRTTPACSSGDTSPSMGSRPKRARTFDRAVDALAARLWFRECVIAAGDNPGWDAVVAMDSVACSRRRPLDRLRARVSARGGHRARRVLYGRTLVYGPLVVPGSL